MFKNHSTGVLKIIRMFHKIIESVKFISKRFSVLLITRNTKDHFIFQQSVVQIKYMRTTEGHKRIIYGSLYFPDFSAQKLKLSITSDVDNSGNFTTVIKSPGDACGLLYCPLEDEQRRIFDVYLMLDKRASVT